MSTRGDRNRNWSPQRPYTPPKPALTRATQFTSSMAQSNQQHTLQDQYVKFRQQVAAQPPTSQNLPSPHQPPRAHDLKAEEHSDMDVQLENVSPERGGSSLQMSFGRNSIQATQATPCKSIHISESTPPTIQYRNPRLADASESQTTKRRKAEDYTATSPLHFQVSTLPHLHIQGPNVRPHWALT